MKELFAINILLAIVVFMGWLVSITFEYPWLIFGYQ